MNCAANTRIRFFPKGLAKGKYKKQLQEASNIVVLKPEVAEVFPNDDAVNNALLSLMEVPRKTTRTRNALRGQPSDFAQGNPEEATR